ncbi:MAG: zinc metallopeptidase [Spirochaetales bacterium]|jgi:Zn-dependent membrane protease YugP|nr:zinc metallopeptidase [Spirochaetales bacterium]
MYFDSYYLILVVPTLILSMIAQGLVSSAFSKYSKVRNSRNMSGRDAAALLMRQNGINDVRIEEVRGSLTDHYDPSAKVLRLSQPVYANPSIAAVGVAAHETGHAIQHARGYGPLFLRSTLVPLANIGSSAGPVLAIIGLGMASDFFFILGILLFSGAVLFYLITLPVEFNASSRAIALLRSGGVLSEAELAGVKKVLTAAALTYVASALTAVASLLRLILLSRNRRR